MRSLDEGPRDPVESVLGCLRIVVVSTDVVRGGDFRMRSLFATVGGVVPVANRIQVGSARHTKKKNRKRTWGFHVAIFEELGQESWGLCSRGTRYILLGAATVSRHDWCFVQLSIGSNKANKFGHCAWDRSNEVLLIQLLLVLINKREKKSLNIPTYLQKYSPSL